MHRSKSTSSPIRGLLSDPLRREGILCRFTGEWAVCRRLMYRYTKMKLVISVLLFVGSSNLGNGQDCSGIPKIKINGSNTFNDVAVFGNSYHIMCSIDAIIQMNREKTINGQSHTIHNFSESDQGTYKCVCHQDMGDLVESKELILVAEPTKIEPPKVWLVKEGTTAEFSCGFNFVQSLQTYYQVTWYNVLNHQNQQLYSNLLSDNSCSKCNITVGKSLVIPNISSEDAQWVYCLVHSVKRYDIMVDFKGNVFTDVMSVHILNQTSVAVMVQTEDKSNITGLSVIGGGQNVTVSCHLPPSEKDFPAANPTYTFNITNSIIPAANGSNEINVRIGDTVSFVEVSCSLTRKTTASSPEVILLSRSQSVDFIVLDTPKILLEPFDEEDPCNRKVLVEYQRKNINFTLQYFDSKQNNTLCTAVDGSSHESMIPGTTQHLVTIDLTRITFNVNGVSKLFMYFFFESYGVTGNCQKVELTELHRHRSCFMSEMPPATQDSQLGSILGGVLGMLLLVVAVILVCVVYRCYQRKRFYWRAPKYYLGTHQLNLNTLPKKPQVTKTSEVELSNEHAVPRVSFDLESAKNDLPVVSDFEYEKICKAIATTDRVDNQYRNTAFLVNLNNTLYLIGSYNNMVTDQNLASSSTFWLNYVADEDGRKGTEVAMGDVLKSAPTFKKQCNTTLLEINEDILKGRLNPSGNGDGIKIDFLEYNTQPEIKDKTVMKVIYYNSSKTYSRTSEEVKCKHADNNFILLDSDFDVGSLGAPIFMANQGDPELGELQVVGLVIGRYMERKKEFTLGFRLKALFALIDQKKEELSKDYSPHFYDA